MIERRWRFLKVQVDVLEDLKTMIELSSLKVRCIFHEVRRYGIYILLNEAHKILALKHCRLVCRP